MDIWSEIRNLQGDTLKTLDRGNPFDVSYVGNDTLFVSPQISGKARPIKRGTFEEAFNELRIRGELSRSDIQTRSSRFNPAYIAAILSKVTGVRYRRRPIVLSYNG